MRMKRLGLLVAAAMAVASCGGGGSNEGTDEQGASNLAPAPAPASSTPAAAAPTSPVAGPASVPVLPPVIARRPDAPPLGVNLEALDDWARLQPFADLMKTSRPWGTADAPWDEKAVVDAQGWPTGDASVVAVLRTFDAGDENSAYRYLKPGVYALSFLGKARVTLTSSQDVEVRNYLHDPATNRSTADVVVGAAATQIMLGFRETSGGVRDVSLLRPGYTAAQTFTDEFRQAVAPFGVLRLMDYLASNSTRLRSWQERTTPASATQAGRNGGSYEYAIQMANELGKDLWINVPVLADDEYVRSLAQMLKRDLSPQRTVYLEYSNELWNTQFPQTADNRNAAVAEAIAGDKTLTGGTLCTQATFDAATGGPCNAYWAGYFRVGKRLVRISQIFGEVFGPEAINTRVRPVYAAQWASSAIAEQVLKNIATYRGKPSSLLYAVAGAPYVNLPQEMITATTSTPDQIHAALQTSLDTDYAPYFTVGAFVAGSYVRGTAYNGGDFTRATQKAIADYYGIKSFAYEGGPDLGQSDASALAKRAANLDPRMGNIVTSQLAQWYGCGNDLFVYFNLTSAWNKFGHWGLTNDAGNLNSPKYAAARRVAESSRSEWNTCR
ncbi:MAG: Cellulose-binding domain protein [Ramlibacter sp.]|nr:Cellulose-binding domain protein [Ramlibacter sp.]